MEVKSSLQVERNSSTGALLINELMGRMTAVDYFVASNKDLKILQKTEILYKCLVAP
jgi:hypothetical protein